MATTGSRGDDDDAWAEAAKRAEVLRKLAGRKRTAVLIGWACEALGVRRTTLYALLKKFDEDPTIESLLPQKRGWQRDRLRLPPEVEEIVQRRIEECYAQPEEPTIKRLHAEIEADLLDAGLRNVDYETVARRVRLKNRYEMLKKRQGAKRARDQMKPFTGKMEVSSLLDVVMIDHAKVDVLIVEEETRKVICRRPWITIAIDVASRMVLGYYLTQEHPSSKSVAMTLAHAVLPKRTWFERLGIPEVDYPAEGLPHCIHMDNAKEFKAKALTSACENFGIKCDYRLPKRPEFGSYIERYIGTLMRACHLIPGTTKSSPKDKGDYDSPSKAILTISELEHFIAREIIKYHHDIHSEIFMTPIAKWHELLPCSHIERPLNTDKFYIWFLPQEKRQVTQSGISHAGLYYRDAVINKFIDDKKLYLIKYDPFSVKTIWLLHPNTKSWVPVRSERLDFPDATLWELRAAKTLLRAKGRATRNPRVIKEQIFAQREIIKNAKQKSAQARRDAQRLANAQRSSDYPDGEQTQAQKTRADVNFDAIDVNDKIVRIDPRKRLRRF